MNFSDTALGPALASIPIVISNPVSVSKFPFCVANSYCRVNYTTSKFHNIYDYIQIEIDGAYIGYEYVPEHSDSGTLLVYLPYQIGERTANITYYYFDGTIGSTVTGLTIYETNGKCSSSCSNPGTICRS